MEKIDRATSRRRPLQRAMETCVCWTDLSPFAFFAPRSLSPLIDPEVVLGVSQHSLPPSLLSWKITLRPTDQLPLVIRAPFWPTDRLPLGWIGDMWVTAEIDPILWFLSLPCSILSLPRSSLLRSASTATFYPELALSPVAR